MGISSYFGEGGLISLFLSGLIAHVACGDCLPFLTSYAPCLEVAPRDSGQATCKSECEKFQRLTFHCQQDAGPI